MTQQVWRKGRVMVAGLLGVAMLTLVGMWGCGTDGYNSPSTEQTLTKTDNALIEAATLKAWVDAGLVNKKGQAEKVVVLEVTSDASYAQAHIPEAVNVNLADLTATRLEGPAYFGAMVATGEQVDALIQKAGIDQNTTIVFTTSEKEMDANTLWNLTRGYTTFRYWGFPKERLKVLNGGNKAWMAAGYTMTAKAPTVAGTSYTVTAGNVNKVQQELRASLSEMIAAVDADQSDFIDGRPSIAGGTTDLIDTAKFVVFEGRIKATHSRILSYSTLVDKNKRFLPIDNVVDIDDLDGDTNTTETLNGLKTLLNIQTDTAHALCRAGNIASVIFFAIDGYAYYDGTKKAVWYDGSWGQWGQMAPSNTLSTVRAVNAGGKLPTDTVWSTISRTNAVTYNIDTLVTAPATYRSIVDITSRLLNPAPPVTANQIEEADKAYRSPTVTTGSLGATANAGGGC